MAAEVGDRFRTESGRQFTLVRQSRMLEPGWTVRFADTGKSDWISNWQLSHCIHMHGAAAIPTDEVASRLSKPIEEPRDA